MPNQMALHTASKWRATARVGCSAAKRIQSDQCTALNSRRPPVDVAPATIHALDGYFLGRHRAQNDPARPPAAVPNLTCWLRKD